MVRVIVSVIKAGDMTDTGGRQARHALQTYIEYSKCETKHGSAPRQLQDGSDGNKGNDLQGGKVAIQFGLVAHGRKLSVILLIGLHVAPRSELVW